MEKWTGASGVCMNEFGELLMVLQGKPEEEKKWSVPSGGLEEGETPEECCVREIKEETGYMAKTAEKLMVKNGFAEGTEVTIEVHYFKVNIIAGELNIQDPDQLIHDAAWISLEELKTLDLCFPEDRDFLIDCITKEMEALPDM